MERHCHLALLGFLACATTQTAATSARSSSGLKRRQNVLESVQISGSTDEAKDYGNVGLRVHRLGGVNTELHITGMKQVERDGIVMQIKKDSGRQPVSGLGKVPKLGVRRSVDPSAADWDKAMTSNFVAPSFFQMDSVTEEEAKGEEQSSSSNSKQPSDPVDNKDVSLSSVKKLSNRTITTPIVAAQVSPDATAFDRVKDLSDRTIQRPFVAAQVTSNVDRNSFLQGWVKDMVAVGERGAAGNDLTAVDGLGGPEAEANYSAVTEGSWLLACLGGLLFFSCTMICLMKAFHAPNCWAARRMEPTTFANGCEPCKAVDDIVAEVFEPPEAPSFQAVVNSALVTEEVGVEELLSAVAGLPAERTTKSQPDVSETDPSHFYGVSSSLSEQVKTLPPCTEKLLSKLTAQDGHAGGYDCALARPLSFCQVMRMQATVLQPGNSDILTPLALQTSVLYQVTVSWRLHAGMPPVPVAYSAMSSAFQVAPCERPDLRVSVEGGSVTLFDTVAGYFTYKGAFAHAPGHLQDYVLAHRSVVPGDRLQNSSALWTDATPLEFQECALLVGSKVTLVGELSRGAGGDLVLSPAYLELPDLGGAPRVLISDDHRLLE